MQELGLKSFYSKAKYEFLGRVVRGLLSLSLVPLDRVFEGYGIITQYANQVEEQLKPQVEKLIKYYYNTWLTGPFKIETWNFFASFMQRTNNPSEGFNHTFNSRPEFGGTSADPNLWLLVKVFLKFLKLSKQKYEQLEVGKNPRHRRGAVTKHISKENARHALMQKLTKGKILLPEYMNTVGITSLLIHGKKPYVAPEKEHEVASAEETTTPPSKPSGTKTSDKKESGAKSGAKSGEKVSGKKSQANTPDAANAQNSKSIDKKESGAKSGAKSGGKSGGKSGAKSGGKSGGKSSGGKISDAG